MKNWESPMIEELDVKCTENGTAILTNVDEVRIDQYGNYWVSFSGEGKEQDTDGEVIKK